MEVSQNLSIRHQETPKRNKPSDDEFSPETSQQQKVHKKMEISPENLSEILDGIRKINGLELSLSNVMHFMKSTAKSEELEPLRVDIAEIKNSQNMIKEKIESMQKRVSELETDLNALKNGDVEGMFEEVDQLRACTQQLSQSNLNNFLIIRHFPLEIKNNRSDIFAAVKKVFTTLQLDIHENDYEASAMKVRNKDLAFIQLKFASQILKSKVLSKFRQMKKIKENEPQLVVEKLTGIPANHPLNGTVISMHNRLTKHNIELLQIARTHVPKYFDFVFDDTEGRILAKCGDSFTPICSTHDIETLVAKSEQTKRPPPSQQSTSGSSTLQASGTNPRRGRSGASRPSQNGGSRGGRTK